MEQKKVLLIFVSLKFLNLNVEIPKRSRETQYSHTLNEKKKINSKETMWTFIQIQFNNWHCAKVKTQLCEQNQNLLNQN